MLLEGMGMLLAGLWLLRRSHRSPIQPPRSVLDTDREYRMKITELEYQAATKRLETAVLEIKGAGRPSAENGELDQWILTDALHRESRAKAALVAVLQWQGCDEEQIEAALKAVDNEPES
jgi:hypothetical protein